MRRVLTTIAIAVAVLLAACGDDPSSSGESTTTTRSSTTAPKREDLTEDPRIARFCAASDDLGAVAAALPADDLESLRRGAAAVVSLLDEMQATAPARLTDQVTVLNAAAVQMQEAVEATDDVEVASTELAALQSPAVAEATSVVAAFNETKCGKGGPAPTAPPGSGSTAPTPP